MTATTRTTTWEIDSVHSSAEFAIKHMMISTVRGRFNHVEGTIEFDPENPAASKVSAKIDASSIATGQEQRDAHLRSADFFEVERWPYMTFESTKVDVKDDSHSKVTGNLTIRDVTKEVTLDVEYLGKIVDTFGKERVGFEARGKINRKDFGLNWNQMIEAGGVMVGDNVDFTLNIAATAAE